MIFSCSAFKGSLNKYSFNIIAHGMNALIKNIRGIFLSKVHSKPEGDRTNPDSLLKYPILDGRK